MSTSVTAVSSRSDQGVAPASAGAGTTSAPSVRGALASLPRLTRVLRVLARRGLLGALRGRAHWPPPAAVRGAIEELGPVYVKFGQVLAMRRDLLPAAYVDELERLHDRMPAIDFETVRAAVEGELVSPLEELFSRFDPTPIAAASIAQVHDAVLPDGRRVVVKVRRPALAPKIAEDTTVLTNVAALAEQVAPHLRPLDLVGMVREFRASMQRETDLALEARTIARFRDSLADAPNLWIPDVVPERSTRAILTLEHSPGERIDRYAEAHPGERPRLAAAVAALVLHQVFETGLFHADPHPGNLFVLPDGRLCLHDFGMIGELDERLREGLAHVLEAVVADDARAVTDAYLELGMIGEDADRAAIESELGGLLRQVHERPIGEVSVGETLEGLLRIGGQHRVANPGPVLLLARAFLIAESLMRGLDPQVDVIALFAAEARRVAALRLAPARLLRDLRALGRDTERMIREAPADARRALRRLADGDLGRVHSPALELLARRASRSVERLTGGVIAGALVVAGALLVNASGWHHVVGDALLVAGLGGAGVTALGALISPRARRGTR